MNRLALIAALSLVGALVGALVPCAAQAGGGLFGDAESQNTSIHQTEARVIFWVDHSGSEPYAETHIQFKYEGDAERFAWIIPVLEGAEVSVGSQALFDMMLHPTVKTIVVQPHRIGDCDGHYDGCGSSGWKGSGALDTKVGDDGSPSTFYRGSAGAFEYVTLTGDSAQEILDWLDANGYAHSPDTAAIVEAYLQEGFVFVAVKLKPGHLADVHPLVIRQPGVQPYLPIRLTSVSAVDDMNIRALFFGESRAMPSNWPHVEVNLSRYGWWDTFHYEKIIGLALDEAGGRAFVTEYAGPIPPHDPYPLSSTLWSPDWNAAAFEGIAPELVVDELENQKLIWCDPAFFPLCKFEEHPLVQMLLEKYLPPPEGVGAFEFWNCLSCQIDQIDPVAWSAAPGFAADFEALITGPGQHALDILEGSSYMTRLFTRLSPHEMIDDPLFHETDDLPPVSKEIEATITFDCDVRHYYVDLPDGRTLVLTERNGATPELEDNPAALRIERFPLMGTPTIEVDNRDRIDAALDEYNRTHLGGPYPNNTNIHYINCSTGRVRFGPLFLFFAIFGIAWFNRGSRR